MTLNVKNSGIVQLSYFDDGPDGLLVIAEENKNIPFAIKRVYYISNFKNKNQAIRGKHAHRTLTQVIFCVQGSFDLELDDGVNSQLISMGNPRQGVILGRMLWHTMKNFSEDCVILVLASDYYDESDYIRNYDEFLSLLSNYDFVY